MRVGRFRILPILVMSAIITALTHSSAEACVCYEPMLGDAYAGAKAVFIAKAQSFARDPANPRRRTTTLTVSTVFKGPARTRFTARDANGSCGYNFTLGETYLIYARAENGGLCADKCTRVRLLSAAATDLQYLNGLRDRRPQGLVMGVVRSRGPNREALYPLRDTMDVVVTGGGVSYSTSTEPVGLFTFVLPPGEYEIRVTQKEKTLLPARPLVIKNGETVRQALIIESPMRGEGVDRPGRP